MKMTRFGRLSNLRWNSQTAGSIRSSVRRRLRFGSISTAVDLTLEEVRSRYLTSDAETGRYITRELPCPFLDGNLCGVYEVRPAVCADYPHLQRNLRSRLWQVIDNATTCPIVYNVLERLKKSLGFVRP